jgi:hypothetical protein
MAYPKFIPVFTKDDILLSETEYEHKDGRKTTVGWLKHLFLFSQPDAKHIWITEDDRKIYKTVLDKFKKLSTIGVQADLHEWEDKTPAKKQAECLNKLRRALGYTEIMEI